ncbi:sulfotransferase family protein [Amorphoplanes digitatis]|uniref:LPS sulfotransferase NodH n=1 Tax=Actinoplanes digitatis TaxID=1868 RepID=A0A7W7HRU9_9ACTN|nr:sulfotransferase [Actinoplanes digitatis]MBB4759639.1 LPS sulfotransferase NodH [Actinoplanes digitatis]GID96867.1 sulfotransferase [Actinoplanes digitatis]
MTTDRPIIVVGCPRSGTTMLQLMLHAHPRIAIPPETRFTLAAYWERRIFGDLSEAANRRALAHWIIHRRETRFCDLGLPAEDIAERITAGPGTLGSALGTVFQRYAARFGKPRWGDKRPAYLNNVDILLRLFPDAQFINIVRDGRDCVASLKEMSWHRKDIYATVAAWSRAVDDARRAARRLGPTQWHEVRYEDLVADPHAGLAKMCAYLGEQYDPAMAEPSAVADVAVPSFKTWHARTHAPVTTQRIQSWQTRLTSEEIALCEAALGSRLEACGYDLSGTGRPAPAALLRYGLTAAPQRFVPARRGLSRAANRLRRGDDLAYRPTAILPQRTGPGPQGTASAPRNLSGAPGPAACQTSESESLPLP